MPSKDAELIIRYQDLNVPFRWIQLYRETLREIHAGVLEPGDEVWGLTLADEYGICYKTVQRALNVLMENGYLKRTPMARRNGEAAFVVTATRARQDARQHRPAPGEAPA